LQKIDKKVCKFWRGFARVDDILQDSRGTLQNIEEIAVVVLQALLSSTRIHSKECMKKMPRAYNPSDEEA
jgi:hypothetical protein